MTVGKRNGAVARDTIGPSSNSRARVSYSAVEVDTSHFKGNFPESCSLEACNSTNPDLTDPAIAWTNVLPRTKLQAHTRHHFDQELIDAGVVSHLRFNIFPDGGVSRLRVYGTLAECIEMQTSPHDLASLNELDAEEARKELLKCCGATRWAGAVEQSRPYRDVEELIAQANEIWWSLTDSDWLEAFRSHPKIGEKKAAEPVAAQSQQWSAQEQRGVQDATPDAIDKLAPAESRIRRKIRFYFYRLRHRQVI